MKKQTRKDLARQIAQIKANNWILSGDKKEYQRLESEKAIFRIEMTYSTKQEMIDKLNNISKFKTASESKAFGRALNYAKENKLLFMGVKNVY